MTRALLLAFPLMSVALVACGQNDANPGPGGVTIGEARALDEAAEMIEQRATLPPITNEAEKAAAARNESQSKATGAPTD